MAGLSEILAQFGEALTLERECGTRTVECDRALLMPLTAAPAVSASIPAAVQPPRSAIQAAPRVKAVAGARNTIPAVADFAFLLETEPQGPVAELLVRMSEACGYGPAGILVNNPAARVLIVLGSEALHKWLPGVNAVPGKWVTRGETPALVTASPTKTYRFFAHDPMKIRALKIRLRDDLVAAFAKIGKQPPWTKK